MGNCLLTKSTSNNSMLLHNFEFKAQDEKTVELRKTLRDETLLKRRNVAIDSERELSDRCDHTDLSSIASSDNSDEQLNAVIAARKLLSSDNNPPIDELIKSGIVAILVQCLQDNNSVALQLEAVSVLTDIMSGKSPQTQAVVEAGAVPIFLELLRSANENVCHEAVWALGDIVDGGAELRDYVIQLGVIEPLLDLIRPDMTITFLQSVTWLIVRLCRSKEHTVDTIKSLLPALAHLMSHTDLIVLADTVWAVSYLTEAGNERIKLVINSEVMPNLVPLLSHREANVRLYALQALTNIATGTDEQTRAALNSSALSHLPALLSHPNEEICLEAIRFVWHIVLRHRLQAVIDAGLVTFIIQHFVEISESVTQRYAARAISYMAIYGNRAQISYLVEQGVIEPLCNTLVVNDVRVVEIILSGLVNILNHYSSIVTRIQNCDGLAKIDVLRNHDNEEIAKLADDIIEQYFSGDNNGDPDIRCL